MREADEARRIAGYLARLNISRPAQMCILHMADDMVREHEREDVDSCRYGRHMAHEKGGVNMNHYIKPEGCDPGIEGCQRCKFVDCVFDGHASSKEFGKKKTATAGTVTAVKRFSKYSNDKYTTFSPGKVNSMFPENSLSYFLVGGI